jgi:hypothetical protein
MNLAAPGLQIARDIPDRRPRHQPAPAFSDLFMPLDDLLVGGGDPRLALDRPRGVNGYGCRPFPSPEIWSFASSTASPISERAYARAGLAREKLMRAVLAVGFEEAFDRRVEGMREELRHLLGFEAAEADVVFSPSGTDSQLHALFLARTLLGPRITTIVVGSDQTGSGTAFTARGRHFSPIAASGRPVRKDTPIAGLSCDSVGLPLTDQLSDIRARANVDLAVLDAIEAAVAAGSGVLLQIMDSSKLGWRAPSDACLDEIASRWPDEVTIVVDACQMRLSRRRLRSYLHRGYIVLVTGSKYFGGPAFSGALLVPACQARTLACGGEGEPSGLLEYACCSDWPKRWVTLRTQFEPRFNLGQWLRWEAALEEIKSYYDVPYEFRVFALHEFRIAIESLIALSPSLRSLTTSATGCPGEDEEFSGPTIFPVTPYRAGRALSAADCRVIYQLLGHDFSESIGVTDGDREVAGRRCLVGQPVRIERRGEQPSGALRLCLGARHVTEAWSADPQLARENLEREVDRIAGVIAKVELLLAKGPDFSELAGAN